MKALYTCLSILTLLMFAFASEANAQPKERVSPIAVSTGRFDDGHASVYYSRPSVTNPKTGETRKIWGGLIPYGKVWRTGANEATLLVTQQAMVIGETKVPAGAYSLFTLPMEDGSLMLIVNKQVGQWGTKYDETQDLARIPMEAKALDTSVERFTIELNRTEKTEKGVLKLTWDKMEYSVGFVFGVE